MGCGGKLGRNRLVSPRCIFLVRNQTKAHSLLVHYERQIDEYQIEPSHGWKRAMAWYRQSRPALVNTSRLPITNLASMSASAISRQMRLPPPLQRVVVRAPIPHHKMD